MLQLVGNFQFYNIIFSLFFIIFDRFHAELLVVGGADDVVVEVNYCLIMEMNIP